MLKLLRWNRKEKEREKTGLKSRYEEACIRNWEKMCIDNALCKIEQISDVEGKRENIEFLIKVLLNDIQADSYTYYIKKKWDFKCESEKRVKSSVTKNQETLSYNINNFFPRTISDENGNEISLEKEKKIVSLDDATTLVFTERTPSIKEASKFVKKLKLSSNEYYSEDSDSFYLKPFNICLVHNKVHSVACALLERMSVTVNTVVVDLDEAVGHVAYDKENNSWVNIHTNEPICDCSDYRMGLIWILYGMSEKQNSCKNY